MDDLEELLGPLVLLMRRNKFGNVVVDELPVRLAMIELIDGILNGIYWKSAWIDARGVDLGMWDRSL